MIRVLKRSPGKVISLCFLSIGIFMIMQIVLPVISFQFWAIGQKYNNKNLISPKDQSKQILGVSVQNKDNFSFFVSSLKRETQPNYDQFTITVPKIKIEKIDVFVDTNDLSKGFAHLPGSALPGEKGNVFISGHSALSQLFSLKSVPFSKLTELRKGDQIIIETPGSKFVYEVSGSKIVDPNDSSVVTAPESQGRYISLMTCVPPGLNLKRLVVSGKML